MDKNSETWREVSAYAETVLTAAATRLETFGVGPEETGSLRGQILAMRTLLAWAEPELRVVAESEDYGFQGIDDVSA